MDFRTSMGRDSRRRGLVAALVLAAALVALVMVAPVAEAGYEDFALESSDASLSTAEAGEHADFETRWTFTKDPVESAGPENVPWAAMRDLVTELPPGLFGNPAAFPTCEVTKFVPSSFTGNFCPSDTQVGIIEPGASGFFAPGQYQTPLINLEPPAGDPHIVARLGFVAVLFAEYIDIRLDPKRNDALTATLVSSPSVAAVSGSYNHFWGVPTDPIHDTERFNWLEALSCGGQCGEPVETGLPPTPFMANPTSCGPAEVGTAARSYERPQGFDYAFASLADIEGCDAVPFEPTLSLKPTTRSAAASSGVDVSLQIPQDGLTDPEGRASANLKKAVVTLPEGVSLNASAVEGLGSCTQQQIGVDRLERQIVDVGGRGAPVALSFEGQSTPELPKFATAAQVQAALEGLSSVGPGDLTVSGLAGGPWTVDFGGSFAGRDVPSITGVHSEMQQIALASEGGDYTLSYEGETTSSIAFDADAAAIQAALEALPAIAPGDLEVTGGPTLGTAAWTHQSFHIVFGGALMGANVPAIAGNNVLTGGPAILSLSTLIEGGSTASTHTIKQGGSLDFDDEAPRCPESSKVASGEITTPVLHNPLRASVYIASQGDNPFNSLFAGYLVAQGSGVMIKVPARIDLDPRSGQIVTTFDNNPQQPFSDLELHFKGGNRGLLTTPTECGTYRSSYELTPWSGTPPVTNTSEFTLNENCGAKPFAPGFHAGSSSALAGSFSNFTTQVTRDPGSPALTGISVNLPPGVSARLAGIPSCPDSALASVPTGPGTGAAQIASPSCPAASQVGTVAAGTGSGLPFYVRTGKVYLAGPYKGAPLSLAVLTPAVAGPFDLGNVPVRVPVTLDPATAQVHAKSDPLPTMLQGVPLELRDVRVVLDRSGFALNPTDCSPEATTGTIEGAGGASASVSDRFQVGECAALGFKPKLSLNFKGGTTRGKHPALTAVLRPRPGDANISNLSVVFPKAEFLDQSHIGTVCTRVQFAADQCPAASAYGTVTATTPLLEEPLQGKVYLRSSSHELPDLVTDLRGPAGRPIRLEAVGRIDSVHGGLRSSFEFIPDAPITRVVLKMKGGRKGLLQNSRNICATTYSATANFGAHNGRAYTAQPALQASCRGKGKGKRHSGR